MLALSSRNVKPDILNDFACKTLAEDFIFVVLRMQIGIYIVQMFSQLPHPCFSAVTQTHGSSYGNSRKRHSSSQLLHTAHFLHLGILMDPVHQWTALTVTGDVSLRCTERQKCAEKRKPCCYSIVSVCVGWDLSFSEEQYLFLSFCVM